MKRSEALTDPPSWLRLDGDYYQGVPRTLGEGERAAAMEVVPASQLAGAVSAIREIATEMRTLAEWKPEPEMADEALRDFADRLDTIGGQ